MRPHVITLVFLLNAVFALSQSPEHYQIATLTPELSKNANAALRYEKISVDVVAKDEIVVTTHRVVTVFNKKGNRHINAGEGYSNDTEINQISARVYDASGQQIKRFKEKDFNDESAVSDYSIYGDNRVKYLNYIPLDYPYTLEYKSEVEYTNTAFFPSWNPLDDYYLSVEHAELEIINSAGLDIRLKKENFKDFNIESISEYHYIAKNLNGIPYEAYAPDLNKINPRLKGALSNFSMIGVEGQNNNWQDFGKWMHDRLLAGTDAIPQATKEEIIELTKDVDGDIEKAKIVYQYMQDRTRYISIQIGIGGWKPMLATEVDKLGYGDCKGLTNYTKSLMDAAGVTSYYTLVYGGRDPRDLDSEFSSQQGNHAILAIPVEDSYIFLECTNQTAPFGFIAGFTDDREVLVVKPDGGEIVRTKRYDVSESYVKNQSQIVLDTSGAIQGEMDIVSSGFLYNLRSSVESMNHSDQILEYKEEWGYLNDLSIKTIEISNDKEAVKFNEKLALTANNYASKSGNRLLFQPNIFNRRNYIPPRYSNRQQNFEISRAYEERDEYIINFSETLELEAVSDNVEIETKFGSYQFTIDVLDNNTIRYTRKLQTNKGVFDKEEYKAYRNFRKKIVKSDKAKIVFKTI